MNILLLASKNSRHVDYLNYISSQHTLYTLDDEDELYPDEINALIVRPGTHLQQEIMEQYPNIEIIFVTGVWTNHIDKEYCMRHSIQIINRPGSNARAVADLAVRWILTHARNTLWATADTLAWTIKPRDVYCGRSLCELSYGFIGCGMISLTIWETLQWFGVKQWMYYDPYVSWNQSWISQSTLDDVSWSDCLIIWAPHTPQTHEMVNASVLKNLPHHAIVINIARGEVVNEDDLLDFLVSRPDCTYYTDVWQWDPTISELLKKLSVLPNFIATPHIAAQTHEAQKKMHYFEMLA